MSECLWSIACISSSLEKKVCVKKWWSCTDCICSRSIVKVSGEMAIYPSTVLKFEALLTLSFTGG